MLARAGGGRGRELADRDDVRARLSLQNNAGRKKPEIEQGHAVAEAVQRFADSGSERQIFDKFPEFAKVNVARYSLGLTLYRQGEFDKARTALTAIPGPERIGIAADEVVGTYLVTPDAMLEQAPENVPHCIGMLRHDDRLALLIDLRRLLEVFPGPVI